MLTSVIFSLLIQFVLQLELLSCPLTDVQEVCPKKCLPLKSSLLVQKHWLRQKLANGLQHELDEKDGLTVEDQDPLPLAVGRSMFQNKSLTGTVTTTCPDQLNMERKVNSSSCWQLFGRCIGLMEWLHNASFKLPARMVAAKVVFLEIQQHVASALRQETVKVSSKVKALVRRVGRISHGQAIKEYPVRGFLPGMRGKGDIITGVAAFLLIGICVLLALLCCLNTRHPSTHSGGPQSFLNQCNFLS